MHAPLRLRVFATLVLAVSVVAPVLSNPVGYVFGPPKLIRSIDLFAANLLVIRVTRLPHVTTLPGPAATMGRSAAWFPSLLG